MSKSRYVKSAMSLFWSKKKSIISFVKVNGEACVDPHDNKGDDREPKSLWRKVTFAADSIDSPVTILTLHGKGIRISPVPWRIESRSPFQQLALATGRLSSFALTVSTALSSSSAFLRTCHDHLVCTNEKNHFWTCWELSWVESHLVHRSGFYQNGTHAIFHLHFGSCPWRIYPKRASIP